MELNFQNPDINDVDRKFYAYNIQHNKKYDYYLIKCQNKLLFKENQYSPYVTSKLFDNKTVNSWQKFLEKVIDDFKNNGYNFNPLQERNIVTKAKKMDMSYDLYIRQNMHAVEWKSNAMINKNKNSKNKLIGNWRHSLIRKVDHVPI